MSLHVLFGGNHNEFWTDWTTLITKARKILHGEPLLRHQTLFQAMFGQKLGAVFVYTIQILLGEVTNQVFSAQGKQNGFPVGEY